MTKKELIKKAKKLGLEADEKMTVKQINALIKAATQEESECSTPEQAAGQEGLPSKFVAYE